MRASTNRTNSTPINHGRTRQLSIIYYGMEGWLWDVWRLTVVHSYSKKMLESGDNGDNQIKKKDQKVRKQR
jgi:hypothetical protein